MRVCYMPVSCLGISLRIAFENLTDKELALIYLLEIV